MKVLTLKLGDQSYSTGKITAYLSREALKIQSEAIKVAKRGQELIKDADNLDMAGELIEDIVSIRDKKSWLLCQVYGDQFTIEDLERELDDEEIDTEVNRIISGISGVVTKN